MLRSTFFATLASLLALVAADGPNAFIQPVGGWDFSAGTTETLQWTPTASSGNSVTLVLRSGNSANLNEGTLIASGVPNNGAYTWNIPSSITRGTDYTVEIVSDSDSSAVNYSHYFTIQSNNVTPTSTGLITLSAVTAASTASSLLPSSSATASLSTSAASSSVTSRASSSSSTMSTHTSTSTTASRTSTAPAMSTTTNAAAPGNAMGAMAVLGAGLAFLL